MPRSPRLSRSRRRLRPLLIASSLATATALTTAAPVVMAQSAAAPRAEQLWSDFCHYVLIASPQLAGEAASALLEADAGTLLDAVEASDRNANNVFQRTTRMGGLKDLGAELQSRIQEARISRSREEDRIKNDIQLLGKGQRAYTNATQRLASAGQYAAPLMLATLIDGGQSELHPEVMRSMTDIGRALVAPLSAALPKLDAVAQGQVSRVLADIGYPQSMPALKQVIENPETDPTARSAAQAAIYVIAENANLFAGRSAAEFYLDLGLGSYDTATEQPAGLDGYDTTNDRGVSWYYDPELTVTGRPGLVPITVPGAILGDVLAMQSARTALSLNPDMDAALSLYVMANLRRENRLPEGENDASYPASRRSPAFYAMTAGPRRLHDVLEIALTDNDTDLALDAIAGLSATASLEALQPLVRGLTYPSREVRFRAAAALAHALPTENFTNDFRVVPVLGDAIRPAGAPLALIIASDQAARNQLVSSAGSLNYRAIAAESVGAASDVIAQTAGIDLLLVDGDQAAITQAVNTASANFKLASTPLVALAAPAQQARIASDFTDNAQVTVVASGQDDLGAAIALASEQAGNPGASVASSEADALEALDLLASITTAPTVFNIQDALPALKSAASDAQRPAVAARAGDVLALINDPAAQVILTNAALSATGELQAHLLQQVGQSANRSGNLISADLSDAVLNIVKTAEHQSLADAAAQAHGALALPTRNAVDLILE